MTPPTGNKPNPAAHSLEATIQAYDRELHAFLMRRLKGNVQITEDIRQEIYLRMLRFTNTELLLDPRAYLYRVAKNVLHDKLLLAERHRGVAEQSAGSDYMEDHTAQVDNAYDIELVLSKLPPMYRAVLQLRMQEGLSYEEIAKALDLSIHTIKKYMHAALVQCRTISLEMK